MNKSMRFAASALIGALALLPALAAAQTTDGYHSIQVLPVVVDTASFTQRFNLHNNNDYPIDLRVNYYPAAGTSGTAITCPHVYMNLQAERVFTSLRQLCPALPTGSQFGFLVLTDQTPATPGVNTFAGFSRISNPQGNGFTVESFAANQFNSAALHVTGLRRLAATPGSPAYQTNCFFGNMPLFDTGNTPASTNVHYTLHDQAGFQIGMGDVPLLPGQFTRLLDVFAASGAPAGDQDDAMLRVNYTTVSQAGLIAFCTVQDNTSFGADFRIAKQVGGHVLFNPGVTPSAKDILAVRDVLVDHDALGRPFVIPPGVYSNTHVVYYRQPDYVMCEIINPATGLRADPSYGLEIRTVDQAENTKGGGNNAVALPPSAPTGYMGDKENGSNGEGANGRTVIEVEDSETNSAANRPYKLHCRTGSGTTGYDMLRYQEPIGRF